MASCRSLAPKASSAPTERRPRRLVLAVGGKIEAVTSLDPSPEGKARPGLDALIVVGFVAELLVMSHGRVAFALVPQQLRQRLRPACRASLPEPPESAAFSSNPR